MENPFLPPSNLPSRSNFRPYHEIDDWLGEGETLIEMHGHAIRAHKRQFDGQIRTSQIEFTSDWLRDFKMLVNIQAQAFYDLHRKDYEIQ